MFSAVIIIARALCLLQQFVLLKQARNVNTAFKMCTEGFLVAEKCIKLPTSRLIQANFRQVFLTLTNFVHSLDAKCQSPAGTEIKIFCINFLLCRESQKSRKSQEYSVNVLTEGMQQTILPSHCVIIAHLLISRLSFLKATFDLLPS